MKNKKTALIGASASALLGMAALVGGTYALFSDSATVSNHLRAGSLRISLVRTSLKKASLDSSGYIVETIDDVEKDFTEETNDNIFGIGESEYVVPCSSYTANMRLINGKKENGVYKRSSVAFGYDVKIVLGDSSDETLSSQLRITVGQGSTEKSDKLSEFGSDAILSGVMETTDESSDFWVKVEFVDQDDNNDAQSKEISFDLVVEATQLTEKR